MRMWQSKQPSGVSPAGILAVWLAAHAVCAAEEPARPHFWDEIPASPSTTVPAAITDNYWHGQFQRVNREVAAAEGSELVFFGDSITWSWSLGPATGKKVWEESFGQYRPINMGNSGDITPVMLYRLTHGNLAFPAGKKPKVAVLLCGTNNFTVSQSDGGKVRWELGPDCPPEDVAAGMRAIAQAFRRALPRTRVILMGILPVKQPEKRKRCEATNAILATCAFPRDEIVFLDAGKNFLLPDGSQNPRLFTDGTHLTEEGYRTWARSIAPVLKEMLKAPPLDPMEILLVGDCFTEGARPETTWRHSLDGLLRRKGLLVDFIGSRRSHHEGHWGKDSPWLAENTATMLSDKAPDLAVVQLGSAEIAAAAEGNDVSAKMIPNLEKIVAALRAANPRVKIVLPTTIPVPGKAEAVRSLNQAIASYAETQSTEKSLLAVADLTAALEPDASEARRMAEVIGSRIESILGDDLP